MTEEEQRELYARLSHYDETNLMPLTKHWIGIVNIYRRLRLFYGKQMQFVIESHHLQGTCIRIEVPFGMEITEESNVPGFFD